MGRIGFSCSNLKVRAEDSANSRLQLLQSSLGSCLKLPSSLPRLMRVVFRNNLLTATYTFPHQVLKIS